MLECEKIAMRLVLLGPPGAGKGAQAVALTKRYGIPHLSTGEMLRAAAAAGTRQGHQALHMMAKGMLVPDDLVLAIVRDKITLGDGFPGFVLDGFPRTLSQARALELTLHESNFELDAVIAIEVDDGILLARIHKRAAESAGAARADDTPQILAQRLKIYHADTAPLLPFYRERKLLYTVDGSASVENVMLQIQNQIARFKGDPPTRS